MRVSVLRFNGQLEIPGMAASSRFRITEAEGFAMTVTPLGILARHERRELDMLIPWVRIDSADVLPEADPEPGELAGGITGARRGPGRPPKAVA